MNDILTDKDKAKLFSLLWSNSLIGLAEVDINQKFVKVNQLFCDMVGYAESELVGKTWMSITHPEDIPGDVAMTRAVSENQKNTYGMFKRYKHKFGHWIKVYLKVVGYYDENKQFKMYLVQVAQKDKIEIAKDEAKLREEIEKSLGEYKENLKWIIGAAVGSLLTIVGAQTKDSLTQNAGLAILATVFGIISRNKSK